jgi:hypothetical protein
MGAPSEVTSVHRPLPVLPVLPVLPERWRLELE